MKKLLIFLICMSLLFSLKGFSLQLKSPAFKNNGKIPVKFSCDGKNISPELVWTNAPKGTKSFVLIMDDPDAPMGTWVHWVIYNIPVSVSRLKENFPKIATLKNGITQGKNSWGEIGYGGPCPPKITGSHRYFFKLYAIDTILKLKPGATKKEVLTAIKNHILEKAVLMARYKRK